MTDILRTIGRYDLLRPIGVGGMAIVYLARQTDLDRLVAVKELRDFHDADPGLAERFIRESRLGGGLAHQNIVTVHDYAQHDGVPYIVMEYLRLGSLRPLMSYLSMPQIAGVLEGMLSALDYAEAKGVVHRDLKPENVMVTDDGRVKIADFGIAKHVASQTTKFRTRTGQAIGTPTYMSPEQALADADAIGPRSDLYAIGVMAYEMLCGRPPFEGDTPVRIALQHVNDPLPPPLSRRPDLNPAVAAWLEKMLRKAPEDRPAGADAAWRELEDALADDLHRTWRRQARLLPSSPETETPRPLTPAPFSDERADEPAPAPPLRGGSFVTFVPGGVAAGAAPEERADEAVGAGRGDEAGADEAVADEARGEAAVADEAAADEPAEKPREEPPDELSTIFPAPREDRPAARGPRDEPPGPEVRQAPAVEPAGGNGAPPGVESGERYETFGRKVVARGAGPAAGPPVAPVPVPPEKEAHATTPPVPAAAPPEAAPLPPRPPEGAPPREEPTVAPRGLEQVDRTRRARADDADDGRPPKARPRVPVLPLALLAAVALAAVLGVVAGGAGGDGGGGASGSRVDAAGLRAELPAGFTAAADVPSVAGLRLRDAEALRREEGARMTVLLGRAGPAAATPGLLPERVLAGIAGATRSEVDLGDAQALRYSGIPVGDGAERAVLYAVPATRGVSVLACAGAGAQLADDCEAIAATVRVTEGRALPVGPSADHAAAVSGVLARLDAATRRHRGRLAADSAAAQAAAATALAGDFAAAARGLRRLEPGPADARPTAALAAAASDAASAYRLVAARARAGDASGHAAAAARAEQRERRVARALRGFGDAGYEVRT